MEKHLKAPSVYHEEISVKYTNGGISTNRMNYGFETSKVADLPKFLTEKLGRDRYNKVLSHFKREIEMPRENEYMMIGHDGVDYEVYVEYGIGGKSYDIRKDSKFVYHLVHSDEFDKVYKYLEDVLPDTMYTTFCRFLPARKCRVIYAKQSPLHRCVYLFRPMIFPQVKFIKDLLMRVAEVVNVKRVNLDDNLYLSFVAIGITHDNAPELAYYFRRERSQLEVKPSGFQKS